jgi:hypothetical protein
MMPLPQVKAHTMIVVAGLVLLACFIAVATIVPVCLTQGCPRKAQASQSPLVS